jgi:chromosome segregation ATPase
MTPDQVQAIINVIGQIFLYVLSGIGGGVVAKVTTNAQDKSYKDMFQDAIKRSYDLGVQVDELETTVKEQKVQIDSQNVATLVTANDLKNLSEDRRTLRLERDDYMKSWGVLETQLKATQAGQQSDGQRIQALERQVEELTSALKQAKAALVSLQDSYEKLSGEKMKADAIIATLEGELKDKGGAS